MVLQVDDFFAGEIAESFGILGRFGTNGCRILENTLIAREKDLCFFVFSKQGITSIEVTHHLREHGYEAHNLGKTEKWLILLKRKIEDLSILRECGIV